MIRYYLLSLTGPGRGRQWVLCSKTERIVFHRELTKRGSYRWCGFQLRVELEPREVVGMTRKERRESSRK